MLFLNIEYLYVKSPKNKENRAFAISGVCWTKNGLAMFPLLKSGIKICSPTARCKDSTCVIEQSSIEHYISHIKSISTTNNSGKIVVESHRQSLSVIELRAHYYWPADRLISIRMYRYLTQVTLCLPRSYIVCLSRAGDTRFYWPIKSAAAQRHASVPPYERRWFRCVIAIKLEGSCHLYLVYGVFKVLFNSGSY